MSSIVSSLSARIGHSQSSLVIPHARELYHQEKAMTHVRVYANTFLGRKLGHFRIRHMFSKMYSNHRTTRVGGSRDPRSKPKFRPRPQPHLPRTPTSTMCKCHKRAGRISTTKFKAEESRGSLDEESVLIADGTVALSGNRNTFMLPWSLIWSERQPTTNSPCRLNQTTKHSTIDP